MSCPAAPWSRFVQKDSFLDWHSLFTSFKIKRRDERKVIPHTTRHNTTQHKMTEHPPSSHLVSTRHTNACHDMVHLYLRLLHLISSPAPRPLSRGLFPFFHPRPSAGQIKQPAQVRGNVLHKLLVTVDDTRAHTHTHHHFLLFFWFPFVQGIYGIQSLPTWQDGT